MSDTRNSWPAGAAQWRCDDCLQAPCECVKPEVQPASGLAPAPEAYWRARAEEAERELETRDGGQNQEAWSLGIELGRVIAQRRKAEDALAGIRHSTRCEMERLEVAHEAEVSALREEVKRLRGALEQHRFAHALGKAGEEQDANAAYDEAMRLTVAALNGGGK